MTTGNHCQAPWFSSYRISYAEAGSFSLAYDPVPHAVGQHSVNQWSLIYQLFSFPYIILPIVIFSCAESLYLVQCSHLEHFYRFFKSGIPGKPYFTRVFLVVPIISLSPIIAIFTVFSPFFPFLFFCLALPFFFSSIPAHHRSSPSPFTQCTFNFLLPLT